ncbi:hypothetical protein NCCP2222_25380 [Sporosarcina sp. NCCP-2222]|nr:hypothetical protein [Sporosarcina sp. NCCP-2222]GKV56591.1 hypothetical protein NCCP2222_25380 [Sporosarcina sp. NCCP-2222]
MFQNTENADQHAELIGILLYIFVVERQAQCLAIFDFELTAGDRDRIAAL